MNFPVSTQNKLCNDQNTCASATSTAGSLKEVLEVDSDATSYSILACRLTSPVDVVVFRRLGPRSGTPQ